MPIVSFEVFFEGKQLGIVHIGHCESKGKTGMFEGKQLGMEIFGARNVVKKGWRTDQSRCLQLWICVCLSATPTNKINLARTHLKTLPDDAHDNIPDFIGPWIFHASNACCIVNQLWSLDNNNKISFPPYYIKLWEWPKKDCVWHRGVRHIRAAPKELIMEDKAPQLRKRKKRGWAHVGAGADKEPTFDVGYDAGLDDVGLGVVLKFLLIPIFCLIGPHLLARLHLLSNVFHKSNILITIITFAPLSSCFQIILKPIKTVARCPF